MEKSKLLRKSFYASFAILANGYPSATPTSQLRISPFDYAVGALSMLLI